MADARNDPAVQKALEEFQQYLSDTIAPLVVADAISILMRYPPQVMASSIYSWVSGQYKSGRNFPISDYFFHAIKKIHLVGEYKLLPEEDLSGFLERLKEVVLSYCPPEDRDLLRNNLESIQDAPSAISSPVEVIYRQGTSERPLASGGTRSQSPAEVDETRFDLLMRRFERSIGSLGATPGGADSANREQSSAAVVSDTLAEAARSARVMGELERWLEKFRGQGIAAGTEEVFKALGRNVPGWNLQMSPDVQVPEDSNIKAMHRIVTQAPDPAEAAVRFHQMVKAAIDRFNDGYLSQASAMMDLAQRIIAAKEVESGVVESVRRKGDQNLDQERLRRYAENPAEHVALRKFLNFFIPLSPEGLLESLRMETKRERRRLLLLLLESHGDEVRKIALDYLKAPLSPNTNDEEIYFRRNLMYLLRRIPASPNELVEDLVETVEPYADLSMPPLLVKEAIAYFSQLKHEKTEKVLVSLLREVEAQLLNPDSEPGDGEELQVYMDRITASLARLGTVGGWRAVVDHGFKKKPKLGNTVGRLAELSSQDLTMDPATAERLITAIQSNLPVKLFGLVLQQKDQDLKAIISALSSTPLPQVRHILEEVQRRFPDRTTGLAASRALANLEKAAAAPKKAAEPVAPSLMGDLEVFGLPALLQSLSDSAVSGNLVLKTPDGKEFGVVHLEKGKFKSCKLGVLDGATAFYQLFEAPNPGTFHFMKKEDSNESSDELQEILPLMLEGIRRYDEYQQARAVLADDATLIAKATSPTPLEEEKDGLFFRDLWTAVRSGANPHQCEATLAADAFRVRRLLVHWLTSGSLEAAT